MFSLSAARLCLPLWSASVCHFHKALSSSLSLSLDTIVSLCLLSLPPSPYVCVSAYTLKTSRTHGRPTFHQLPSSRANIINIGLLNLSYSVLVCSLSILLAASAFFTVLSAGLVLVFALSLHLLISRPTTIGSAPRHSHTSIPYYLVHKLSHSLLHHSLTA
ncbi:hypothetical protein BC835DRAFT_1355710 [Cytidiella melzeri]|nr:hypothetical protein BC835DRAFT_1355710 [Cytidiella melzeri]